MTKQDWLEILEQEGIADILTDDGYNLDYDHEIHLTVKEIREIANLFEPQVSNANGGQGFFSFMTAELINDEDLQYGNRVRKYWLITCEDWRDTEVEKKFILDARTFPKGTKITLEIPEAGLKQ